MLQVRFELTTSAFLAPITAYKYGALTDCATGAANFMEKIENDEPKIIFFGWKKEWVQLYWLGSTTISIQGCYPITTLRGGFELLSFDPGPVHLSLDNLVALGYPITTILTQSLMRTSYRHGEPWRRTPNRKLSTTPSSQVAELQR